MFLAVDGVGFLAVVDGVPVGIPGGLADFGKIKNASEGVPTMVLPRDPGEKLVQELIKRHAAALG